MTKRGIPIISIFMFNPFFASPDSRLSGMFTLFSSIFYSFVAIKSQLLCHAIIIKRMNYWGLGSAILANINQLGKKKAVRN
jgi:hypothetical protein